MKKNLKILVSVLILGMALSSLTGCAKNKETKVITFADVGWDSILFHNAVAGTVAETVFDYEWTEMSGSTPITHEAVKKGEIDVHMEVWTDNLPDYKGDIDKDELKELGINFDDNAQGFYVPRYVIEGDSARGIEPMAPNLKTVAGLKDYAVLFKDPEEPSKGIIYAGLLPRSCIRSICTTALMRTITILSPVRTLQQALCWYRPMTRVILW